MTDERWTHLPPYNIKTYDLTRARLLPGTLENVPGNFIAAYTDVGFGGMFIRLDEQKNDPIPLSEFEGHTFARGFERFWIETPALPGHYLRLFVGRDSWAYARGNMSASAPVSSFFSVRSDKDVDLINGIALNAVDNANLAGLIANKINIRGVAFQCDQNQHYRLIFWSSATMFNNADLDLDTYVGDIDLDVTIWGYQIAAANQYYLGVNGVNMEYEDLDGTQMLHMSLQNLGPGAKNAGALGEVVVEIFYELRQQ